jgi:hypothetical protein
MNMTAPNDPAALKKSRRLRITASQEGNDVSTAENRPGSKGHLSAVMLLLGSLLVALAMGEIIIRLAYPEIGRAQHRNTTLGWAGQPMNIKNLTPRPMLMTDVLACWFWVTPFWPAPGLTPWTVVSPWYWVNGIKTA